MDWARKGKSSETQRVGNLGDPIPSRLMLQSSQSSRTRIFTLQVSWKGCNMRFGTLGWIYKLYTLTPNRCEFWRTVARIQSTQQYNQEPIEATHVFLFWDVFVKTSKESCRVFCNSCNSVVRLAIWSYHRSIKSSPLRNLGKVGSTESTAWFCAGTVGRVKRSNGSKRKSKGPLRFFIGVKTSCLNCTLAERSGLQFF